MRIHRVAAVVGMVLFACCSSESPRQGRLTGWAILREGRPLAPSHRAFRVPYASLTDDVDWIDVPVDGLVARLEAARSRGEGPDVLAAANFFDVQDLTRRKGLELLRITTPAVEDLSRGTPFLYLDARGRHAASVLQVLAQPPPAGVLVTGGRPAGSDLGAVACHAARAFLTGDAPSLDALRDRESLPMPQPGGGQGAGVELLHVRAEAAFGNERLAFVPVSAVTRTSSVVGTALVVTIFRRGGTAGDPWRLLVAARDPLSQRLCRLEGAPCLRSLGSGSIDEGAHAAPALVAPADGHMPARDSGERFGSFVFEGDPAAAFHLVEFSHDGDARLVVAERASGDRLVVSEGSLWTLETPWRWRAWSVGRDGAVRFSEVRHFVH
jgi:hypothetical protein